MCPFVGSTPLHRNKARAVCRGAPPLYIASSLFVRPAAQVVVMGEQARARRRRASEICWLGRPAPWSPAPSRSHAPLLAAAKQHVRSRITRAPAASCMQACKQAGCTQSLDRPSEQRRSHEASAGTGQRDEGNKYKSRLRFFHTSNEKKLRFFYLLDAAECSPAEGGKGKGKLFSGDDRGATIAPYD